MIRNHGDWGEIIWTEKTLRNPYSTSMDATPRYVTVADGHPDGTPGHFYVFNLSDGSLVGSYETGDMSWPMFISADGSGIAAGSDDSSVYYFTTG